MTQIKTTLIDHMGSDLSVVNAARVSFGKSVDSVSDKDAKLIKYLAKHKHYSPFGHCFASFHVKAPIFVARQLVKHKFLRWNEISRRYVDDEPEIYWPKTWRKRSEDIKQGSEGEHPTWNHGKGTGYLDWVYETSEDCIRLYKEMVACGVAPEQARMLLPQNTMTEWYWSGSLDAFADMCKLRLKEDTQYESRVVAQQIDGFMSALYPVSWTELINESQ